jgi:uncharacterized membrane protein YkvA (DUF1232 family)
MTKVERELIELLEAKYGKAASPSDIIAFLRGVGAIDDILIRKAVIHERFYDRLATTEESATSIAWNLSFEYDVSRSTVKYITRSKG